MNYKFLTILFVIICILFVIFGLFLFSMFNDYKIANINNFEDCKDAGYPIMESYPEQCKTPDNRTFVRIITPQENSFNTPVNFKINENITFSDGLSITLSDINDSRCKEGLVCIWAGELSPVFTIINGNIGNTQKEIRLGISRTKQVIQNDYLFLLNNATETTATITVSKNNNQVGECYVGGCSSQICSDKEGVVSDCMYKEEYACYKNTQCTRQSNGQCGWTQTTELQTCLETANL